MMVMQGGVPILLSASGTISKTDCTIIGYHVNSTSGGTIVLREGAAGASSGTAITGTITPLVGFTCFPASLRNGAYATINGTISVTFFVQGS